MGGTTRDFLRTASESGSPQAATTRLSPTPRPSFGVKPGAARGVQILSFSPWRPLDLAKKWVLYMP